MIHYVCDICKRPLNVEEDARYVVRMEVYAALDGASVPIDDDRDHLEEIQEILECLDDEGGESVGEDLYQQLRFDLCSECRKRFLLDPLGRRVAQQLDFSKN